MSGHPFPVSAPPYPPVTFAEKDGDDSVFLGNREHRCGIELFDVLIEFNSS